MKILYGRTEQELTRQVQRYAMAGRLTAVSPPEATGDGRHVWVQVWLDGETPTSPAPPSPTPQVRHRPAVTTGQVAMAALGLITVSGLAITVWLGHHAAIGAATAATAVSGWLSEHSGWLLLAGIVLTALALLVGGARKEANTR